MRLYFAGIEAPSHLQILRQCGVERVAVNINNLSRHTKHFDTWASKERLDGMDWGCYTDSLASAPDHLLTVLSGAEVQPEWVAGPVAWAENTWLKDSDLGFLPIWDGYDIQGLRTLVEDYEGVLLTNAVVDNTTAVRTARAALPPLGTLGGFTGRTKGLDRFDLLISSAWWAVQKHGETQVWTGNRLIRLNADDKNAKRQRYVEAIEALGCDVSAVLTDDPNETVRCAILSWLALERFVGRQASSLVTSRESNHPAAQVIPISGVASPPVKTRHESPDPVARQPLPTMNLNTVTTTRMDEEGNPVTESHTTIEVTGESARQCSTCQLAGVCPGFNPGAACAYQIPVVIRTKDQRQAVMRALMEIQTQRILMGTFTEQVLGTPDVQVGKEMDRLMNIIEKAKAIEDNSANLRISVDARGEAANMGLISRLFGENAGTNARSLGRPVLTDELIEEAEILDGDDV